jgi:hypothetical protein
LLIKSAHLSANCGLFLISVDKTSFIESNLCFARVEKNN